MPKRAWRTVEYGIAFAIVVVAGGVLSSVLWFALVLAQGGGVAIFLREDGVPTSAIASLVAGGVLFVVVPVAYLLGRWAERRGL